MCWNGFSNSHVHSWELTSFTLIHQIYSETQRADRHHWTQQVLGCQRGCGSSIKGEPVSRLSFNKFHIFSHSFFTIIFAIFSQMRRNSFHLVPLLIIIVLHWCPRTPPFPHHQQNLYQNYLIRSDCLARFDYRSLCNLSCSAADARLISSKVMNSLPFLNNNPNGRWEVATRNMSAWSYRTLKSSAAKSFEPLSSL